MIVSMSEGLNGPEYSNAILNADGVYLATYSALSLNLKLIHLDYYDSEEKSLPMAEVGLTLESHIMWCPSSCVKFFYRVSLWMKFSTLGSWST